MTSWVVLLRGVNVGGSGKLAMAAFRSMLEGMGYDQVATYIQSGNAVLTAQGNAGEIQARIQSELAEKLGLDVRVVVLSSADLEHALVQNPFPEARAKPQTLHLFFSDAEIAQDLTVFDGLRDSGEEIAAIGSVVYLHTPEGFGRSKLAGQVERRMGIALTARNLRTCMKLVELGKTAG